MKPKGFSNQSFVGCLLENCIKKKMRNASQTLQKAMQDSLQIIIMVVTSVFFAVSMIVDSQVCLL